MSFRQDIESIDGLHGQFQSGLQALKGGDRNRLKVKKPICLAGSVDIDSALKSRHPNDPRWDYAVGYKISNSKIILYLIEVHPASGDHTIAEINSKYDWLVRWIATTQLRRYQKRYYWVASGKCSFTVRHPKIKSLAQRGVVFSGVHLVIGNEV
jgi:hypothetical protein